MMLKNVGVKDFWYKDVEYDIDGWVDALKYTPSKFDLVILKTDKNTITGWWTGDSWYSIRLKEDVKVLYWKRKKDIY